MKRVMRIFVVLKIALLSAVAAEATTITFEGFAPAGGLINVNASAPYMEAGYTISVPGVQAAVFDSAAGVDMPGNLTDFFGFGEINVPTLTFTGGSFDISSLLIGPITAASGPVNMTITGNLAIGGTLSASFTGLITATLANLNWAGLQSVRFNASDDTGLDNLVVDAVPEPASLALLALGLVGVGIARSHRTR